VVAQLGPLRTDVLGMDNAPTVEQMLVLVVTWPLGDPLEHVMWTWSLVAAVWGHPVRPVHRHRPSAHGCVRLLHQGGAQVGSPIRGAACCRGIRARRPWSITSRRRSARARGTSGTGPSGSRPRRWMFPKRTRWRERAANAPAPDAERRLLAREVIDRLHGLAMSDPELVTVLDAMQAGATERADLIHATGMSARHLESVRRRLDRLLPQLPASLRPPAGTARARGTGSATRHRGAALRSTSAPRMAA
jgi:hypothetical protein